MSSPTPRGVALRDLERDPSGDPRREAETLEHAPAARGDGFSWCKRGRWVGSRAGAVVAHHPRPRAVTVRAQLPLVPGGWITVGDEHGPERSPHAVVGFGFSVHGSRGQHRSCPPGARLASGSSSPWGSCPECKQMGVLPWQHDDDCVEGLKYQVRFLQPAALVRRRATAVLLMWMAKLIGG